MLEVVLHVLEAERTCGMCSSCGDVGLRCWMVCVRDVGGYAREMLDGMQSRCWMVCARDAGGYAFEMLEGMRSRCWKVCARDAGGYAPCAALYAGVAGSDALCAA